MPTAVPKQVAPQRAEAKEAGHALVAAHQAAGSVAGWDHWELGITTTLCAASYPQ